MVNIQMEASSVKDMSIEWKAEVHTHIEMKNLIGFMYLWVRNFAILHLLVLFGY